VVQQLTNGRYVILLSVSRRSSGPPDASAAGLPARLTMWRNPKSSTVPPHLLNAHSCYF